MSKRLEVVQATAGEAPGVVGATAGGRRLALCRTTACLCAVCCLVAASPVQAQDASPASPWETSLKVQLSHPFGYVQVGENQYQGDRLTFHDLGVDLMEAVDLGLRYHFTPEDALHVSFQMLFLNGSTTLTRDVFFNGTKLEGGTTLDTTTNFPDFFRITAMYERYLLPFGDRGTFIGRAGMTFVGLNFRLQGTIAPGSPGHETKEDFITQELPVPMLGFRFDYPTSDRVTLFASLDGGYLPWINSGRSEGGTVRLTQSQLDALAGVRYAVLDSLSLEAGAQISYYLQHELSHEDDNFIQLSTVGGFLGVRYTF